MSNYIEKSDFFTLNPQFPFLSFQIVVGLQAENKDSEGLNV